MENLLRQINKKNKTNKQKNHEDLVILQAILQASNTWFFFLVLKKDYIGFIGHEDSKIAYAIKCLNAFNITKQDVKSLLLQMEKLQDKPSASQVRYDRPV